MKVELGFSFDILNDSYAAGCAALMVGGVFVIPFALKYGRRPIYLYSLAVQCAMGVLSAKLDNVGDMMGNQVIMCFVGALCEVMAQMTVADIYFVNKRGLINIMYIWTLTIGASLALCLRVTLRKRWAGAGPGGSSPFPLVLPFLSFSFSTRKPGFTASLPLLKVLPTMKIRVVPFLRLAKIPKALSAFTLPRTTKPRMVALFPFSTTPL